MAIAVLFILDRSAEVDALAVTKRKTARLKWTRRGDLCDIVDILEDDHPFTPKELAEPRFAFLTIEGVSAAQIRDRLAPDVVTFVTPDGELVDHVVQKRKQVFDAGALPTPTRRQLLTDRAASVTAGKWAGALVNRVRIA